MIPTKIVPSVGRCDLNPRQVQREFLGLVNSGARLFAAGTVRKNPTLLLSKGLSPKHKIELFDTRFYLSNVLQIPELRFFVGYIAQKQQPSNHWQIFARIIYKDLSLAWRTATHFTIINGDFWVGKGDVRYELQDGLETIESIEATTDLPLEVQSAFEGLLAWQQRPITGQNALDWILRKAPVSRIEPYRDFSGPRKKAAANPRNLINAGRPIARFQKKNDPTSLRIVKGFEPDFAKGIIERYKSKSKLFGGTLKRFRILSVNQLIQYYFIAGPNHAWLLPPQAITTELSSYGVRTIDVVADDDLFIPGYEYHHYEETNDSLELYSQIPPGFAGKVCPADDSKADASPWLDQIPLIQKFRREVLGRNV